MYSEYLSNDIITFPSYKDKVLQEMATDTTGLIEYRMNEHGYRSNSLTQSGGRKILTLGCSWTMGVGVDNDKIWPTLIGNSYHNSVVCNYGMYGTSCEFIAEQYYKILHSGYRPDVVLVLWPGFSRRDYITDKGNHKKICGWRRAYEPFDPVFENTDVDLAFLTLQNDYQDINQFWSSYKFLEETTPSNVLLYHSIAGYYFDIFKQHFSIIEKFIDINRFFIPNDCYVNDMKAADGSHPGSDWHKNFTNNFLDFITW